MTIDGIQDLVQKFGDAAERAKQAGYKLIEVHGAHGYLVNQFLSSFSNIRKDAYGGDVYGKTRFAKEIVEEIRNRVGKNFPISFKISAQEFVSNGLTVAESIKILEILEEAGIDVVQVSAGCDATPEWICQPMFMEKACLADSAAQIKAAINIPVMAVGRINDPMVANKIIEKKQADLVCIARGLLADPEMPNKAKEERFEDIRMCIACNTCMQSIFRKGRVECLVNPSLGREAEMEIRPAEMDFPYGSVFSAASPEAYERLLLDVMAGNATLFARRDEIELAWQFVEPFLAHWSQEPTPQFPNYPAGSWGPIHGEDFFREDVCYSRAPVRGREQ